jgi:photosynthetic reaction center H subunit
MGTAAVTSYVDFAQIVLYMFWIFFFGLIYYLQRESHREGYPMDTDRGIIEGWPPVPSPKVYKLEDGREVLVPRNEAPDPVPHAKPLYGVAGSPLQPVGDPMKAGVGPGAYAHRPDEPDLDHHGQPKIVPLAQAKGCGVSQKDVDPRGMSLFDAAGDVAGTVRELWIDKGEMLFRYLEAEVRSGQGSGTRRVLVPMAFASVTKKGVHVNALYAAQFADVPAVRATDRITLDEEERISAYYGAGTLYADEQRAEPMV